MKFFIKRVSSDDGYRAGGYIVVWGSSDQKDLHGEWFTRNTDLALSWELPRPAFYHHGQDGHVGQSLIGVIDTFKMDDLGVWAEAQLDMNHRYFEQIKRLIEQGVLAWSSGTLNYLALVDPSGEIKKWPIVEGSLTPAPAEPTYRTQVQTIKSSLGDTPEFKNLIELIAREGDDEQRTTNDSDTPDIPSDQATPPDAPPVTPPPVVTDKAETQQVTPPDTSEPVPSIPSPAPQAPTAATAAPPAKAAEEQSKDIQQPSEDKKQMNEIQMLIDAVLGVLGITLNEEEMSNLTQQVEQIVQSTAPDTAMSADLVQTALQDPAIRSAVHEAVKAAKRTPFPASMLAGMVVGTGSTPAPQPTGSGGSSKSTNHTGNNPRTGGIGSGRSRWERAGKSIEDMAFYLTLKRATNPGYVPEEAFFTELSSRGMKAYEEGKLNLGSKGVAALKAMEQGYNGQNDQRFTYKVGDEVLNTGQADFNAEWVPDLWFQGVWQADRDENLVAPLFEVIEMPSNPFNYTIDGVDPVMSAVPETTDAAQLTYTAANPIPITKPGSDKLLMTAKKLAMRIVISEEMEEDNVLFSTLEAHRQKAQAVVDETMDFVILNADSATSGNINLDGGTPAATDNYMFGGGDGLLKQPLTTDSDANIQAGGDITVEILRSMRSKLPRKIRRNTNRMAYIFDSDAEFALLRLPQFLTMDKVGDRATILTGQIGLFDNIPVIITSQVMPAAANGKVSSTEASNTRGRGLLVYRPYHILGYRREVRINTVYDILTESHTLIASFRMAQAGRPERHVVVLRDIALA